MIAFCNAKYVAAIACAVESRLLALYTDDNSVSIVSSTFELRHFFISTAEKLSISSKDALDNYFTNLADN